MIYDAVVQKSLHCNFIEKTLSGYRYFRQIKVIGKGKYRHFDEITIYVSTKGCHFDNFPIFPADREGNISSNCGYFHSTKIEGASKAQFV